MKLRYKKGFNLVELIIVAGLISVIALVVSVLMIRSITSYRINQKGISLQEDAAKVMREFEYSARAASEILTANDNEFSYLRYFDLSSVSPSKIRFFVDGSQFKMGRTEPFGTPPDVTYPSENEAITLLVDNVYGSGPFFKYYDGVDQELSSPIAIQNITLVKIIITLDDDPNNLPQAATETTKIQLRNMKNNL